MKRKLLWFPMGAFALIMLLPIWIAVTGAFSSQWELTENLRPVLGNGQGLAKWTLLPQSPTLKSLVQVLLDSPEFFTMFWNSVTITAGILLGQFAVAVPAAWGLAKLHLPRKLGNLYMVLMLLPFQVLMYPEYLVLKSLGLLNTLWAVILPGVFSAYPVFLLTRFFAAIPEEILEAARLDGAGEWQIFRYIALPLGLPGLLSVGILSFLDAWNLIEQPMTFLKNRALWPLSLFLPETTLTDAGLGFAAALLMLIPALLLFGLCQDALEQGIVLPGGK
ncbi:carbohydrate ABC transporter permease [Pseudoflavonifractor sp. MSJ-30]|uniref:carbohydrate ABC transporter permease n=1 Tax=Pseudoflavonifractor sp. MSJ-30 TaxID=2841525 RepID=UPI001C104F55|nr:carbohydrate ABC transporter permease [Pseudoflavonifractor sp. MSJ-30]MBU5451669.1 carbohydrate ABC transporter permease [Pseudoflavonifractor sp. MSJ-30]